MRLLFILNSNHAVAERVLNRRKTYDTRQTPFPILAGPPAGGRSVGQGAYLSTGLAIRIVAREVGHVIVVVAAVVIVVGMRVVVLGRVASAAVVVAGSNQAPCVWRAGIHYIISD